MQPFCDACARGPAGIEGHAGLWVRSLGASRMSFRCQSCQSLWSRTFKRGAFAWTAMSERISMGDGMAVPPRTVPLPPFAWRRTDPISPAAAGRS